MKEQIKQRISLLNNGEIPCGYKKTAVGTVPTEWTEHTLGDIFIFKNGLNKEKAAFGHGTPIINYTDVWTKRGLKAIDIKGRVSLSAGEIKNYAAKCGDVFFTRTSETINEIGYSSVLLEDIKNAVYSGFVLRARPYNDLVCREYHQYCYSLPLMRREIIRRSSMTTRALTSGSMLSQVSINLPSHQEQTRIAEILMKWDEAIELQETLKAKLETKRAAMLQYCFSPSKCTKKIKLENYVKEVTNRNRIGCSNVKSVSNRKGFIDQLSQFSKQVASEDVSQYKVVSKGCIAYNPSRINVGSIAIYNDDTPGIVSPMYVVFKCHNIDPKFLLLLLETARGRYEIKSYLSGSVRDSLSFSDLKNIELLVPSPELWNPIITLFSTIDQQYDLYCEQLATLKKQRKVLQQYLLSGIVRV